MYSLLFELPTKHRLTQTISSRTTHEGPFSICIEGGMTSSVYGCEADGRKHHTKMEALLDEAHGTFSLLLTVKPDFRLRDIFNRPGGATQTLAADLSVEDAQKALAAFEERCEAQKLPLKEGPLVLNNHYSHLKTLRDDSPPQTPRFASARAVLDQLKPR
ncbi:MAG: hypothetical protein KJ667_08245 [Alphaproteobacteria bacterium]|nr:hypothetical protein [Alphaproteobacteria bacterium]